MSYSHIKIKNSVTNYVYMLWAKWQNKVFFNSIQIYFVAAFIDSQHADIFVLL